MYVGVSEGGCRLIFLTVNCNYWLYVKFLLNSGTETAKFT